MSYGAEALTLKVRDERKITSMETWHWHRMKRTRWLGKITDNSILTFANVNFHTLDTFAEIMAAR